MRLCVYAFMIINNNHYNGIFKRRQNVTTYFPQIYVIEEFETDGVLGLFLPLKNFRWITA
jgi:hypothetical protein